MDSDFVGYCRRNWIHWALSLAKAQICFRCALARGTIFQYDVFISITKIMLFVCKQTVRTVFCTKSNARIDA